MREWRGFGEPWMEVLVHAGYGRSERMGSVELLQPDIGYDGPVLGLGARGGLALGAPTALVADVTLHRMFTRKSDGNYPPGWPGDAPQELDGWTGVTSLAITVGLEFSPGGV
ncbi:hypothetical protein [Candidatus Palauibacter sp.]|uniref:hypothetical protein n=2 Tax=Candidatus Palauibacter sp. TaxID=3101350 RepID=UPI003B592F26